MFKIRTYIKPYKVTAGLAILFMLLELVAELWHPIFMAKIIDEGILKKDLPVIMKWGGVMVGLSLFGFLSGIINSFFSSYVSQSFGYDIRKSIFEKIQAFSFANFNRFPTSSLITRMTNDVTQLQGTVFASLRIMLRAPLLVLGGAIMALTVNVKLALILIIVIPALTLFLMWMMKKASFLFRNVQKKLDYVNLVMRENLIGIRLIKAFLRKKHEINRFTNANEALMDKTIYAFRLIEVTLPTLVLVMNVSILVILWLGGKGIESGSVTAGDVVAIVNYATRVSAAISMFTFIIMNFSRAQASTERIKEVMDTEIDLIDAEDLHKSSEIVSGKIEFNQVFFRYPDTNENVLEEITFTVEAGQTMAILGATGSGKSSLFQLIPRLYDTTAGKVLIDGQGIERMKLEDLRKQIGFVPQEALLFTGTVSDNIAWGKENAAEEEIIKAAQNAQIHDTIMKLPNQYETALGQRGVNLSGGQKQRLSIARALVRKPKILMLDDSTSALDLHTESKLLQALRNYSCTTLIITQKISTALQSDIILLLEEGRVIGKGTHEELIQTSTLYQQIFASQFGEEKLQNVQTS